VLADLKEEQHGKSRACIADLSDSLKGVSDTVYADSGHLLPTGNKIVAARILDELLSCGFLEKHSGSPVSVAHTLWGENVVASPTFGG
jgi:hypothetical protein